MQPHKLIIKSLAWFMITTIAIGIIFIVLSLTNKDNLLKYDNLYIHSNADSVSLTSQIIENNRLLVLFFHPECDYCHGELNLLSKVRSADLVVDLVSYAPKKEIDSLLQTINLHTIKECNVIYDSSHVWYDTLNILTIPTTLYFNQGKLIQKRIGYFDLKNLLNEKERN